MTTLLTMKGFNKKIDYLCFTANTAGSTVKLQKNGSPTSVTLETSTDGSTRTAYTIGSAITLSNVGDKVWFRNSSETPTNFSTSTSNYYKFSMSGSIAASGDIQYLLCKNGANYITSTYCFYRLFYNLAALTTPPELTAKTLNNYCYQEMFEYCTGLTRSQSILPALSTSSYCYYYMFSGCTSLKTVPKLPATTLSSNCYYCMFYGCTSLVQLPNLPATGNLPQNCYYAMFQGCSLIKLSTTQTGSYTQQYRIPPVGNASAGSNSTANMFTNTGGTFKGTPTINTTYYTSNQVI